MSAAARQYATTGHAATHFQDAESLCDAVDLGYFFLLRVSEFAASGDAAGAGPLLGRDVCFTWADGYGGWLSSEDPDAGPTPLADVVVLRVKGAKNDVSCGGQIRAQYATGERCCPVKAASDARRRISGGHLPLFPGTSGAIVTAFVRLPRGRVLTPGCLAHIHCGGGAPRAWWHKA